MEKEQVFKLLGIKLSYPYKAIQEDYQLCTTRVYDNNRLVDVWLLAWKVYAPYGTGAYLAMFDKQPDNWNVVVKESNKGVNVNSLPSYVYNMLNEDSRKLVTSNVKQWKAIVDQEPQYLFSLTEPLPVVKTTKPKAVLRKTLPDDRLVAHCYTRDDYHKTWWLWWKQATKSKKQGHTLVVGTRLFVYEPEAEPTHHTVKLEGQSSYVSYAELCALASQMAPQKDIRECLKTLNISYFDNKVNLITTNGSYYSALVIQHIYNPVLEGKSFNIKADKLVDFLKTIEAAYKGQRPIEIDSSSDTPKLICGNVEVEMNISANQKLFSRANCENVLCIKSDNVYQSNTVVRANLKPAYVERVFVETYSLLRNEGYQWECHAFYVVKGGLYQVVLSKGDRAAVLGLMKMTSNF